MQCCRDAAWAQGALRVRGGAGAYVCSRTPKTNDEVPHGRPHARCPRTARPGTILATLRASGLGIGLSGLGIRNRGLGFRVVRLGFKVQVLQGLRKSRFSQCAYSSHHVRRRTLYIKHKIRLATIVSTIMITMVGRERAELKPKKRPEFKTRMHHP